MDLENDLLYSIQPVLRSLGVICAPVPMHLGVDIDIITKRAAHDAWNIGVFKVEVKLG